MMFGKRRKSVFVLIGGLALVGAGIGISLMVSRLPFFAYPKAATIHLSSVTQNEVRVDVNLERDSSGAMVLAATYTPLQPGFHLYSKDLPLTGIDGVGRPTLLEIPVQGALQASGTVSESVQSTPVKIQGLDQPFPIYPDGPVTLRLPVTRPDGESRQAQISVSYMACSLTGGCYPPVMGKVISAPLPPPA